MTCTNCRKPYYSICRSCFARELENRIARKVETDGEIAKRLLPFQLDRITMSRRPTAPGGLNWTGAFE